MLFLFAYHYYEVANGIYVGINESNSTKLVGNVIELGFVLLAVAFFLV
jgi:hypothetical protein